MRTRKTRYCDPVCKGTQEWKKGAKEKWTCKGCGRTGLLIRGRHRSWPPPIRIPVRADWRGARNEVLGYALVSPIDAYLQDWKWRANRKGYVYRQTWITDPRTGKRKRSNLFLQRIILKLGPGDPLEGHHKDDDPWNNQRWNLEVVTREENERYKHARNIRNGKLPQQAEETVKAESPRLYGSEERERVLSIIQRISKNGTGYARGEEVIQQAHEEGLSFEQAEVVLRDLTLQNQVYAKAGRGTFALL